MIPHSDRMAQALRSQTQRAAFRVEVLRDGRSTVDLPITGGSVVLDADAAHRRAATLHMPNRPGLRSLLGVGAEVRISRGVMLQGLSLSQSLDFAGGTHDSTILTEDGLTLAFPMLWDGQPMTWDGEPMAWSGPGEGDGSWTSPPIDLTDVLEAASARVEVDATVPDGASVTVETSTGGQWREGVHLPHDLDGVLLQVRLTLTSTDELPVVHAATLHVVAADVPELVPLGTFVPVEPARSHTTEGGTATVRLHGRTQHLTRPLSSPVLLEAGGRIDQQAAVLIRSIHPGAQVILSDTPDHVLTEERAVQPGGSPLPDLLRLVEQIGCEVYDDHRGRFIIRPVPEPDEPVREFAEGDGFLMRVDTSEDLSSLTNGILVVSQAAHLLEPVVAEAWDDNPDSPVRREAVGQWPRTIDAALVDTPEQAETFAAAELRKVVGVEEQMSYGVFSADPTLEPWDTTRVTVSGFPRHVVIRRITIPLDVTSVQDVSTSTRHVTPVVA